jgi:AraC-like DNA-binding protein
MRAVWSPLVRTRFATDNVEVAHDLIARMYANNTLQASGGNGSFRLEISGVGTTDLRVDRLRYGVACSGVLRPVGYLLFHTTTAGRYQMTTPDADVRYSRGMPGLVPLGVEVGFRWSPDYEVRVLPLRWQLVAEHAAAMTGTAAADLRFQDVRPVSAGMARHWEATLDYVDRQLDPPDSALAFPLVRAQVLATLAASALAVFPNTTMTAAELRGPGAVAPSALRRAVAYMEAHAEEPIRLRDIAEAAGTSSRSVQHAFARHLDASPMSYLQRVRLERAHRDLQVADPAAGDTVAAIARGWGFAKPGHFASIYRRRYGVLPSHTLRR